MKINEIFYSIQGEGIWTGLPNIFIRTSGCNLRCSFCDTKYAYEKGKEMTINDIMKKISNYSCKYICLTGGEPLLQNSVFELIEELTEKKYKIILETNGSCSIKNYTKNNSLIISLDVKCPSSNMHEKMDLENINLLREKDQLKFVIKNRKDYCYAKKIFNDYKPTCNVFFQPVWGTDFSKLAGWINQDNLNVKLGIQLHKVIWGDIKSK